MAVDNIDLSGEIKAWKDAAYGKDVRAANVAAFEKIQGTVNDTVQNVNQASKDASSASQNAQKAVDDIQSAIETATSKASEAAGSATAADTSKKAAASSAAAADNSKTQAAASAAEAKKIAQGLGDFDGTAAKVKTTDTYGLVVSALGESTAQALIDAIANKVMNELINKNKIVNNLLATDASTVLAGTQGAALDKRLVAAENAVTKLNSEIDADAHFRPLPFSLKISQDIVLPPLSCGYTASSQIQKAVSAPVLPLSAPLLPFSTLDIGRDESKLHLRHIISSPFVPYP